MARGAHSEAEPVLADTNASVDDYAVPNEGVCDRCARPNVTVSADHAAVADNGPGRYPSSAPDRGLRPHHGARLNLHAVLQMSRGIDRFVAARARGLGAHSVG